MKNKINKTKKWLIDCIYEWFLYLDQTWVVTELNGEKINLKHELNFFFWGFLLLGWLWEFEVDSWNARQTGGAHIVAKVCFEKTG